VKCFAVTFIHQKVKETMKKKISPANHQANQQNANKGTNGVNRQYAQSQGNREKQLNPNQ
jgi:hypothetical protein